ncbi:MAG: hypothetical protein ACMXYG_05105 [Candidatus Woesearchaeota archaeon]
MTKKTTKKNKKENKNNNDDKAPEFIDINSKNLRNNFGYPAINKNETRISEFKSKSQKNQLINHIKKNRNNNSNNKTIEYLIYLLIIIVILALIVVSYLIYSSNNFVENGECSINIRTYEDTKRVNTITRLGLSCNYTSDCKQKMLEQRFSEQDVRRMRLRCIE